MRVVYACVLDSTCVLYEIFFSFPPPPPPVSVGACLIKNNVPIWTRIACTYTIFEHIFFFFYFGHPDIGSKRAGVRAARATIQKRRGKVDNNNAARVN